jgi:hypothetical protein
MIREIKALGTGIPMVAPTTDPVVYGLSTNLARPDGDFTGVVLDAGLEIWAKRVQLLFETALADFVVDRDFVTIWKGSFWGSRLSSYRATGLSRYKTLNGR